MGYNNPNGQLFRKQLGAIREEITYNTYGEMIRRQFFFNNTSTTDYAYTRDQLGRITEVIFTTSTGMSYKFKHQARNLQRLTMIRISN